MKMPIGLNIYWAISSTCNLRCKYCYVPEYNKNKAKTESDKAIESTKELIAKVVESGNYIATVALHGAETFVLDAETIVEVVNLFREHGVKIVRAQSNGVLLTEEYLKKLEPIKDIFRIGISLDGYKELNDTNRQGYEKAIAGLKRTTQAGFRTTCITVITKDTLKNLDKFGEWCKTEIEPYVSFHSYKMVYGDGIELDKEEQEQLAEWLIKTGRQKRMQGMNVHFCVNLGNNCHFFEFAANGGVYTCNKGFSESMKIGDWTKDDINNLINQRAVTFKDAKMSEECKECPYWKLCHGGCPLERTERNEYRVNDCYVRKALYKDYINNNDDLVKTYLRVDLQ